MKQESQKVQDNSKKITRQLSYREVEEKVLEFIPSSQTALKLTLAVAASSSFSNPVMIRLLLVGVPSSGKTELVRLLKDSDVTYSVDSLTTNAFVSGERQTKTEKVYDLLSFIDKKCLVVKDWTPIFSLNEETTKKLLGDLVGIYDKDYSKFSSRRGNINYLIEFSQLGCITPATLNRHTRYMNMVGPRFLFYTMPTISTDEQDACFDRVFGGEDRTTIGNETRAFVSAYLDQLVKKPFTVLPLNKDAQDCLKIAAKLVANCRGIAISQPSTFRNDLGDDVTYYEVMDIQVEEPWRAVQQLMLLARYLAFVVQKNEVGIDELSIIKEVVISSMPADRSRAIRLLVDEGGSITAGQLATVAECSPKTSRRLLEELAALHVLHKSKGSGTIPATYSIVGEFRDFLLNDTPEFMSLKASGTETTESYFILDQLKGGEQSDGNQ